MRRESVENLAHRFNSEPEHTRRVAALSLEMFDGLAATGLHELGDAERELLWAACMLHDIGTAIDYEDHHRHSHYMVLNAGLPGFAPRELVLVGLITRYHRKGDPDASELRELAEAGDDERLLLLCALIRLAEQFERSRDGAIRRVSVGTENGTVTLGRRPRPAARSERADLGRPPQRGPARTGARAQGRNRSVRRVAASLPLAAVLLNITAVAVLLPDIRLDLGSSSSGAQWVLNAYLLALAALLPLVARLRGPVLAPAGALAMAAGAVACAGADATALVVTGQAVQGAGAAALLACVVAPEGGSRAHLVAAAALPALALALGPLAGGRVRRAELVEGVLLGGRAAGAWRRVRPRCSARGGERRPPIADLARALAYAAGVSALTIVLVQSEPWGVGSQELIQTLMIVAAGLLVRPRAGATPRRPRSWAAAARSVAALCFLAPEYFELAPPADAAAQRRPAGGLTTAAVGGGRGRPTARRDPSPRACSGSRGSVAAGRRPAHAGHGRPGYGLRPDGARRDRHRRRPGARRRRARGAPGRSRRSCSRRSPAGAALGLAAAGAVFQHVQADQRAGGASFEGALARGVAVGALSLLAFAAAGAASAWLIGRGS